MNDRSLSTIISLTKRISFNLFGKQFGLRVERDNKKADGRIFLQIVYFDKCRNTGNGHYWHGRKWYLSDHMTDDEIIKTSFAAFEAFEAAVKHEVMEGFQVDGITLFNPHVSFEELLKISHLEVQRD